MLNNIYINFKKYLERTFPDIKIDEYRGEFDDKFTGGWNPNFPCCLIKLNEYSPLVRAASAQIISHQAEFTLYIAEKNSLGFDLIQQLIDDLNETDLVVPPIAPGPPAPQEYFAVVNSVKFFKAINSVRVHTLNISIT